MVPPSPRRDPWLCFAFLMVGLGTAYATTTKNVGGFALIDAVHGYLGIGPGACLSEFGRAARVCVFTFQSGRRGGLHAGGLIDLLTGDITSSNITFVLVSSRSCARRGCRGVSSGCSWFERERCCSEVWKGRSCVNGNPS